MGDDLDDFFAKKDKKKSKIKKYTPDLLTSKFNEADVAAIPTTAPPTASSAVAKKVPEKKKEEAAVSSDTTDATKSKPAEPEEEEWANEFEQEKERDYSGLKIQKLQIQDSEDDDGQDSGEGELNEEGEPIKREPAGPWNKLTSNAPTANVVKIKEPAPVENLPNTTGGVYIPPSKRMQASGSGSSARTKTAGKKTFGAPDLSNEEYFPSLGQAQAIEEKNFKLKKFDQQERGFTEAKPSRSHSSRTTVSDQEGPRLNLGNKFHALCNEDS